MNDEYHWKQLVKDVKPLKNNNTVKPEIPTIKPITVNQTYEYQPTKPPKRNFEVEVRKGKFTYDSKIDLHGMTLQEAYIRLYQFILRNTENGQKRILVITGHGDGENSIKREFELWMEKEKFKRLVNTYRIAHRRQGGDGAYYLMLRVK